MNITQGVDAFLWDNENFEWSSHAQTLFVCVQFHLVLCFYVDPNFIEPSSPNVSITWRCFSWINECFVRACGQKRKLNLMPWLWAINVFSVFFFVACFFLPQSLATRSTFKETIDEWKTFTGQKKLWIISDACKNRCRSYSIRFCGQPFLQLNWKNWPIFNDADKRAYLLIYSIWLIIHSKWISKHHENVIIRYLEVLNQFKTFVTFHWKFLASKAKTDTHKTTNEIMFFGIIVNRVWIWVFKKWKKSNFLFGLAFYAKWMNLSNKSIRVHMKVVIKSYFIDYRRIIQLKFCFSMPFDQKNTTKNAIKSWITSSVIKGFANDIFNFTFHLICTDCGRSHSNRLTFNWIYDRSFVVRVDLTKNSENCKTFYCRRRRNDKKKPQINLKHFHHIFDAQMWCKESVKEWETRDKRRKENIFIYNCFLIWFDLATTCQTRYLFVNFFHQLLFFSADFFHTFMLLWCQRREEIDIPQLTPHLNQRQRFSVDNTISNDHQNSNNETMTMAYNRLLLR